MSDFRIGSASEFVQIVLPYSFAREGWAQAQVQIAVQGFRGGIDAWLELDDFKRFRPQLQAVYDSLHGRAELAPADGQIVLAVSGNGRGGITVSGQVWSNATYGNRLEFTFEVDQTFLPQSLDQLARIVARGRG